MNTEPDLPVETALIAQRQRLRVGLATGLMLGFGGLTFVAVAVVLALGLWSARQNTVELTRLLASTVIDDLERSLNQYLLPPQDAVQHLGWRIEHGEIDLADEAALSATLAGTIAGLPQVAALLYLRPDGTGLRILRQNEHADIAAIDVSGSVQAMRILERGAFASGVYWGEVVRPEDAPVSLLNVRQPVRSGGEYRGLLIASVEIGELSTMIQQQRLPYGGEAFVLYDDRYVLAHRKLAAGYQATVEQPLPTAAELDDAVLFAYLRDRADAESTSPMAQAIGVRLVELTNGRTYPLLSRRLGRFGAAGWEIGIYFPESAIWQEIGRLLWAAVAGLVVMVLALLASWWLARYLSRPLSALATAARRVRDLRLDQVPLLPSSRLREIDAAAGAFTSMITGLRWFETYVPKGLVRRLISFGENSAIPSENREVTVLFTDIVGFTSATEGMTATATAAFLNDHFSRLGNCVEAEGGTIDKYIGDALMVFWGAPEAQPDHALRAARAAAAMRHAITRDNRERIADGKPPVRLRIGMHSGPAVVGNIGAPDRINYTIVGDTVNVAQRVEQLGKVVGDNTDDVNILLTASTAMHLRAGADCAVRSLGEHIVRGRQGRVEIFALTGMPGATSVSAADVPAESAE